MRDKLFSYLTTTFDARSFITITFQKTFDDAELSMLNATHLSRYTNQMDKFFDEELGLRDKDWIKLPNKGQIDVEKSILEERKELTLKLGAKKKEKQANKRSGSHNYNSSSRTMNEKQLMSAEQAIAMAFMGKNQ